MTNYERIKQMTVEEMAEFINDVATGCAWQDCDVCVFNRIIGHCDKDKFEKWLNQEEEQNE